MSSLYIYSPCCLLPVSELLALHSVEVSIRFRLFSLRGALLTFQSCRLIVQSNTFSQFKDVTPPKWSSRKEKCLM